MDTYTLAISSYALGLGRYYGATQAIALNHLNTRALGDGKLWSHKKRNNLTYNNKVTFILLLALKGTMSLLQA